MKIIYGGIIDIILNHRDIPRSVVFLKEMLGKLVSGKVPIQDLIITKSLRGTYADPERIAHKVLADRMAARDPGNKPQSSDRIPYVYIYNPKARLEGDRIEHPDYVRAKKLKLDYKHYILNQIMKPVLQIYGIILEDLNGYKRSKDYWLKMSKTLLTTYDGDIAKVADRIATLRENDAMDILFTPILTRLTVDEKGMHRITDFMRPVVASSAAAAGSSSAF